MVRRIQHSAQFCPQKEHLRLQLVSCSSVMSALCEVIVEVQQDRRGELVWVQSKLLQLLVLIQDIVLAECAAHIQDYAIVFPGVAAGVRVVAQVSL